MPSLLDIQRLGNILWNDKPKFKILGSDEIKYIQHPGQPKIQTPSINFQLLSIAEYLRILGCFNCNMIGLINYIYKRFIMFLKRFVVSKIAALTEL